ncbi:response regulator [Rubrobacter indicoceani]|uniref:response regulator n=1 Tax=Rubrobacter indicoceani TaxID=2051957 RepID=UPI000E5AA266|nr:response regulator [Rubrobacter indicoceani]
MTAEASETENLKSGGVRLVAATEDLMFRSRIAQAAESAGIESAFPRSPKKLLETLHSERPDVLVLDLHSERFDAVEILNALGSDGDLARIHTVGYVPHTRKDLIVAAREAGCDRILARSAFFGGLPGVLFPKGARPGEEADELQ